MPKSRGLPVLGSLSLLGLAACGADVSITLVDAEPDIVLTDRGAQLALACSGCHSEQAGAIASLDGYTAEALATRMREYQAERDGTTVMHRLARGYSDADIALISAYLGEQEAP